MYYKTQGIILKKFDVGEADKILTIYSEDYGKIRAIARGSRKPKSKFVGHLDIFNLANINFVQGKSLDHVTGCEIVSSFRDIKKNIDATAQVYLGLEFFDHVIHDNQKDAVLFDTLASYLAACDQHLAQSSQDGHASRSENSLSMIRMLTSAFLVKCLHAIGVLAPSDKCGRCGRAFTNDDTQLFTNDSFEGFFCGSCEQKTSLALIKIPPSFIKAIGFFNRTPFSNIHKLTLTPETALFIDRLMRTMVNLHAQKKLVTHRLIAELSQTFKTDII